MRFVRKTRPEMLEIEHKALAVLNQHGVTSAPIDPVLMARHVGIQVHQATFTDRRISGAISKRGDQTRIFVNGFDSPARKRFTIAHELGHYFLHMLDQDAEIIDLDIDLYRASEITGDSQRRAMEVEANRFAAALLMPSHLVRSEWEAQPSVSAMAQQFHVSFEAMAYRVDTLGLI